jgi:tetratricopeptide (TPR) repeat protein
MGVNCYFQLQDPAQAATYMQQAAKLDPRSPLLASLAARMFYQGNQTEAGIIYLRSLLKETTNPLFRKKFEKRLQALEAIFLLEQGIKNYEERFAKPPDRMRDLVTAGIVRKIPADPYGGRFYIGKDGRIHTTSKMAEGWEKNGSNKNSKPEKSVPKGSSQKTG